MMEEELSMLKKSLISLVVSSPTTMTVSRLLKDYRSMVGGVLPLAKYGYKDPTVFLRERCMDIFVVDGPSWDPILTPKVTKNLAHIDKMVQRQKVQSTLKHKGKRRSVFQPTPPVASRAITKNDPPARQPDTCRNDTPPVYKENDIVAQIQVAEPMASQDHKENNNCNIPNSAEDIRPSSALSKFYKKRLPQYNSDMDLPSPDAEHTSKENVGSGNQLSSGSTSKQALLDELKAEILTLIKDSVEGVWCMDLIKLYKEAYGRELKFNRFGHTSIISLVYSMEDSIAISRPTPNGDWLLQEPGAAPPRPAPPRPAPRPAPPHSEPDDALPGVDFEPDVFPSDCLHYMDSIPALSLDSIDSGSQFEVLIGEVYSPSHFWMLRVGPQHNLAMEQIMDEMTEYYRGEGAGRQLACGAIRVGQHCAALFADDWHRALIVSLIDSDTVKVRHVDYGTVSAVGVRSLKPLLRRWAALPAQAARARLAACRPAGEGWRWPRAACAWLLQLVRDRRLYAHVLAVDREEDITEAFLIDTNGPEDVCLTRELIRVGYAEWREGSALASSDCYLYPRFDALESGATPNYADICLMLADGIALEYVEAYRRHVPGPWARGPLLPVSQHENRSDITSTLQPPCGPTPHPSQHRAPLRPPPGLSAPWPELRLTEAEWAVLSHLRRADPGAAQWYLLTQAWRATMPPPGL